MSKNIEDILKYVTENNEYDASSFTVGIEQEAQSQYPVVTITEPIDDQPLEQA